MRRVRVTDTLPAGVTFQETVGCGEDPNGVPVCTLGTIPAGKFKSYQIKVGVDSATLGLILNTATVTFEHRRSKHEQRHGHDRHHGDRPGRPGDRES